MLTDHTLLHPLTGEKIALPIREIILDSDLPQRAVEDLSKLNIGKRLILISDTHTHEALGKKLKESLKRSFNVEEMVLVPPLHPDASTIVNIRQAAARADVLLAVGSGTINDLCKYAASLEKKPYVVYGTALSMNGYASGNASILVGEYKQSVVAHPPLAIYLDLQVLALAPRRLTLAGLGDSLARVTAQMDWYLSHLLLGTPYDPLPFELLSSHESELLECCDGLVYGDSRALTLLAKLLILSGIGMWLVRGSYPASQGEHMIAHTMEFKHPGLCENLFHGEIIGVTAVTMATLQEKLLATAPILSRKNSSEAINKYFGAKASEFFNEYRKKENILPELDILNARITEVWPALREFAQKQGLSSLHLSKALQKAAALSASDALGWPQQAYHEAIRHAHFTRNRFTFLDIAAGAIT